MQQGTTTAHRRDRGRLPDQRDRQSDRGSHAEVKHQPSTADPSNNSATPGIHKARWAPYGAPLAFDPVGVVSRDHPVERCRSIQRRREHAGADGRQHRRPPPAQLTPWSGCRTRPDRRRGDRHPAGCLQCRVHANEVGAAPSADPRVDMITSPGRPPPAEQSWPPRRRR